MNAADLKSLPAPARNFIKKLETKVARLEREVAAIKRKEQAAPARKARGVPQLRRLPGKSPHAARPAVPASTGLAAAAARGEAAKLEWVVSGEVVPARTLADAWGLTPQALGPAAARGEVFAIVVKNVRYYPREFLELDRDDVGAVSRALGSLSPSEKLVFWKRPHGVLGGKTVLQALSGRKDGAHLLRVTRLAQACAEEANAETDVAEAA